MGKYILNIIILLLISLSVSGQSWLSPWENRLPISVTNYNYVPMLNLQTRLEIEYRVGMQTNFDDLRFTNNSGNTTLPYWIEYKEDSIKAVIWVKVDSIAPFAAADFFLYYANGAASSASNPHETFVFFDDFDEDIGWNDIGGQPSTAIIQYDSITSTLQKFQGCGADGAWKSIGDTISNFKLITREFMPRDSDPNCTVHEYGIESSAFRGINLRRNAMDNGQGTEFGLEIRNNQSVSGITTSQTSQPVGEWYRTALSYSYICHFNLQAMILTDNMEVIGNIYSETYTPYEFDRFTIRGGHTYNLDYIAVANHLCVWPVVVFDEVIETCPQATLIDFQNDLCEEGLGKITLNVAGGVSPYILAWYDGQDSLGSMHIDTVGQITIDSLSSGDYCFKIIDADGCEN